MPVETAVPGREPGKTLRIVLLVAGLVLGQVVLYGPSLVGRRILLPLDLLAGSGFYIPRTPDIAAIQPKDGSLADLICTAEPQRRFAISELRAGRLPTWAPYHYAGAPFVWPKFSPFLLFQCFTASPMVLAWSQLLVALVAGIGAYLFFRRALALGFWSSALCAWCYPLTGFFILWQGFFTVLPVCWLPWLLLAVDRTVRVSSRMAPLGVAALTGLVVVSGQLDVAGQVLLCSGIYGLWQLFARALADDGCQPGQIPAAHQVASPLRRLSVRLWRTRRVVCRLSAGWALGLALATPYLLPVLEYTQTGARMARRGSGGEERPPLGWQALPQIVLPDVYGNVLQPSLRFAGGLPQQESSAAAYAGLLATLLVAPLAFCSRSRRAYAVLWAGLAVFACGWVLNMPGLVALFRLPGLNMMSHNRLVFLAGFAILALAAMGLQALTDKCFRWRGWMWLPVCLLAILCAFSVYRSFRLPEPMATQIARGLATRADTGWLHTLDDVRRMQAWFIQYYTGTAIWCGLGVLGWLVLRRSRLKPEVLVPLLGAFLVGDLLVFAYGRNVQSAPSLYYPPIPVLQSLAKAPPARVMGFGCLPATLASMCGLRDIRGYDAVDPANLVELVSSAGDPISIKPRYAPTMELAPKATISPDGDIVLPPVLDMLGVRYVIFRGAPFPKTRPVFQGFDYWVLENPRALPNAFVPTHVETVTDNTLRTQKIESADFNPRELAFVETPVALPDSCRGTVKITEEIPTQVNVSARMDSDGLVVLTDLWDKGWHAYVDGKPVPILRANHAVRGVIVPAGTHKLQFIYAPASFAVGLKLALVASLLLLAWFAIALRPGCNPGQPPIALASAREEQPAT